jgi:Flp pilus assembly protein protease CpaA
LIALGGFPLPVKLALLTLLAALLISIVTDLRRREILNVVTLPALGIILGLYAFAGGQQEVMNSLLGVAVCGVPFLLAALPGWMGMGDVKLMAVVGAALGWPLSLTALLAVTIAGGVQATLWLVAAKIAGREKPKYVPYGLSIAAGTILAFLLGSALV